MTTPRHHQPLFYLVCALLVASNCIIYTLLDLGNKTMRRLEIGDRLLAEGSWNVAEAIVESVTETEAIAKDTGFYQCTTFRFPRDFEDNQPAIGHVPSGSMGDNQYWYYCPPIKGQ